MEECASAIKEDFVCWYISCQTDLKHMVSNGNKLDKVQHIKSSNINKYKYTDLCDFKHQYQLACRGSTCFHYHSTVDDDNNSKWAWCFNKFFNKHEIPEYLGMTFDELILCLSHQKAKFVLTPKWDGSCIQIVCTPQPSSCQQPSSVMSNVHIYTLGSVVNELAMESHYTFRNEVMKLLPKVVIDYLCDNPFVSLIAEVCTPHNKIITSYDYSHETGKLHYLAFIGTDGLPTTTVPAQLSPVVEIHNHAWSYHDDTDIQVAMNDMLSHPDTYGLMPEGLVLYAIFNDIDTSDNNFVVDRKNISIPIAKIKRQEYIKYTRGKTNDGSLPPPPSPIGSSQDLKDLQTKVVTGTIDDYIMVSVVQKSHVAQFKQWLSNTQQHLDTLWFQHVVTCKSKKEVAGFISNCWLKSYLFECFDNNKQPNILHYLSSPKDKNKNKNYTTLNSYQDSQGDHWFTNMRFD